MVGDGATDAEASPPADAFIGFGGVVEREAIRKLTPWYVLSMAELLAELDVPAS
jgi:phosphoserine phosphatase